MNIPCYDMSNITIQHPNFSKALNEVRAALRPPLSAPSIVLCGPPKVGMSKLRQEIVNEMLSGLSLIETTPVVDVELSFISTKGTGSPEIQLHRLMLAQLKDPYFAGFPSKFEQKGLFGNYEPIVRKFDPRNINELRERTLIRLRSEKCRAVFIDMRQPLLDVSQLPSVANTVRYIQDLACDAGIPFVIFGNYDLVRGEEFLAELSEKSEMLHFERYRLPGDLDPFIRVLQSFENELPVGCDIDFNNDATIKFLYAQSLGCLGRLFELFQKALKHTAGKKMTVLTTEALMVNTGLPRVLTKINESIKLGEKMLTKKDEDWADICAEVERNYISGEPVAESDGKEPHVA